MSVERYAVDGKLLALVLRSSYAEPGIHFLTDPESSQQLGSMIRPAGYEVAPHRHNQVNRVVSMTQEVLFVRNGKCQLSLYRDDSTLVQVILLEKGDVVLLAHGGHGLKMLEDTHIIEVKQGPYSGDNDKTRFEAVRNQ